MNQSILSQSTRTVFEPLSKTPRIKFNLDNSYLSCFISQKPTKVQPSQAKTVNQTLPTHLTSPKHLSPRTIRCSNLLGSSSLDQHFNHKVLFTHYGQDEVYVDCQLSSTTQHGSDEEDSYNQEEGALAKCIWAITEDPKDNFSDSQVYLSPKSLKAKETEKSDHQPLSSRGGKFSLRSKELEFQICLGNIDRDGRTTIMLRNIPNKYTQEMILRQIDESGLFQRYNFFYLPIDYKVHILQSKNDCNVGYAFINLVNTKYIKDLYREFNGKRWRKFNSEKICEVCYARLQGTDQLLNHFRYSNVFQQRDWRLKPLIYLNLEVGLTNGEELSQQPPTSL